MPTHTENDVRQVHRFNWWRTAQLLGRNDSKQKEGRTVLGRLSDLSKLRYHFCRTFQESRTT